MNLATLIPLAVVTLSASLVTSVAAARTCRDLFEARPRLSVSAILGSDKSTKASGDKVTHAMAQLQNAGVRAEAVKLRSWYVVSRPAVRILPEGDALLNRLAEDMLRVYGVSLFYDPKAMNGADGLSKGSRILISEHSAFTGEPDATLFHEIRHAAMSAKEANGQATATNGSAIRFVGSWPWHNSAPGYERVISVQERATSYQGFIYSVVAAKTLLKRNEISLRQMDDYLVRLKNQAGAAREIHKSIRAMGRFEIEAHEAGRGVVTYNPVLDQIRSLVHKAPFYLHMHVVPTEIYRAFAPENFELATNEEKSLFFKTDAGQYVAHQMALEQLRLMAHDAETGELEIERVSNLVQNFEREMKRPTMPIQREAEFRELLKMVLGSKAPRAKSAPTVVAPPEATAEVTPRRRVEWELPISSLLPANGYSFSGLDARFVHEHVYSQNPVAEVLEEIRARGEKAYYGLVDLRLATGDRITLEWNSRTRGDFQKLLMRISLRGIPITEARIKYASPIEPSWLPNIPALLIYEPMLRELSAIPDDLLIRRNRVRYVRKFLP